MTARSWRSGFCGVDMPPDSHDRCKVVAEGGLECSCSCHAPGDEVAEPVALLEPVQIGVWGFHVDIPEEDYHRDPTSLSHSGAKTLLKAPALFRYEQQHPVFKRAFEFGKAAHGKVLGVGAEIRTIPADLLASNGAASTKEAKAFMAKAEAEGAVALKAAEVQQIDDMATELASHHLAAELLSEGEAEVSAYAVDEATGVMRRCRFDWLGPTTLTDYKTADSSDPAVFRKRAAEFGYHMQHGWYLDLARDLGHPAEAFAFIVQMKAPPYLVSVVELIPRAVDRGRELNARALQLYADCVKTDTWPGYLSDTEFASVDLPDWAYYDHEVEIAS